VHVRLIIVLYFLFFIIFKKSACEEAIACSVDHDFCWFRFLTKCIISYNCKAIFRSRRCLSERRNWCMFRSYIVMTRSNMSIERRTWSRIYASRKREDWERTILLRKEQSRMFFDDVWNKGKVTFYIKRIRNISLSNG
jgi:hypothetical protein